ncbi:MoaA/NifB/PqqE/SkfB family radical SAM enzyme [Roseiarcus fermentans]|uniref:MoaA/NifB/PqqE/SkfB family radical SAM enzyme n=1 Tax=Roseiarcus fermentans TaxID=1473586 RepID=A0A366FHR0_9HYPH|nr:radical SAM protein [Roseiarcus fermentans]RBP14141.1 MoaA/NifB/PqqE/SkfB family radical SAM enzyme [Roseiarcus fermentans]
MSPREFLRLARFFAALALKERLFPALHVRPLVAELFLTDNCNLRCVSCACWRATTLGELDTEAWKDVLRQLVALPIHKVNVTGGEPLIRPDAVEIMRFARDIGIRHIHLNTNAILLTPVKLDEVLEAGVRSFNISVDGPKPTHDRIRGRAGAFDRTVAHLRAVIARRDTYRLKIRMNFTVMRDNAASLPDIAALAQDLNVRLYLNLATDRTFLFRHADVSAQSAVAQDELAAAVERVKTIARADPRCLPRPADLDYVLRHFRDVVQKGVPCAESQIKLMIRSRGEIGGCWGHDPHLNVRDFPIARIVDEATYRAEHARFFRKDCVGCGSNYSLNLRWRPSTYVTDALWRWGFASSPNAVGNPAGDR